MSKKYVSLDRAGTLVDQMKNYVDNAVGAVSVPDATDTVAGVTKVYTGTGTATDGTMTQAAITIVANNKVDASDIANKTQSDLEASWSSSSVPDIAAELTEIESVNTAKIENEVARAKAAENALTTDLSSEVARARTAEETNATNITDLVTKINGFTTKIDGLFMTVSEW